MFDPTVFDHLKTVLEGAIYDLDLGEHFEIVDRSDLVDLAKLSRIYSICLAKGGIEAVIELATDAEGWSGEILEDGAPYPCELFVQFYFKVKDADRDLPGIPFRLNQIWKPYKPKIEQHVAFLYGSKETEFYNHINLIFPDGVDESFIPDIPRFIGLILETLTALESFAA